eukprot:s3782_g8.t1
MFYISWGDLRQIWKEPCGVELLQLVAVRLHLLLIMIGLVVLGGLGYEPSWSSIPFEGYDGMTQLQFQESNAPFLRHGGQDGKCLNDIMLHPFPDFCKNEILQGERSFGNYVRKIAVPVHIPPGWRRVEGKVPGKHIYVHTETGTIQRMAADIYHPKDQAWISTDGKRMTEDHCLEMMKWCGQCADVLNDGMPDLLALELAYGGGGKAKKAIVKPKVVPAALPPEPEKVVKAEADGQVEPAQAVGSLPVALLFPGQGSQYVKMMGNVKDMPAVKEIWDCQLQLPIIQEMLDKAAKMLDFDLLELCLKGPESELERLDSIWGLWPRTKACQPAMFVAGLAAVEKLRAEKPEKVERCQAVAGLSLGEYTALAVAGVFDFETGLKVVKLRGEAMQEAAEASQQAMLSVAGLDKDQPEQHISKH